MSKVNKRFLGWSLAVLLIAVCMGFLLSDTNSAFQPDPQVLTGLPTLMPATHARTAFPPTWTPSPTAQPTVTSTPRPTVTPTTSASLPAQSLIKGVIGQTQKLPLDCEAAVAVNWAAYFGFTIDELEFFGKLPVSDNPSKGFVGDVQGKWGSLPPEAYGVHAAPIATLLRKYGVPALEVYAFPYESLQREIARGNPVIVWVVGHVNKGKSLPWRSSDGVISQVAAFEHTVMIIGYDDANVTILDGENIYQRPLQLFLDSWSVLGRMGIIKFP